MRIDHHAYQRGTRVAAFGLALQAIIGLTLLIFSRVSYDTAFYFASIYVLLGTLVWLSLIIIFHQHKLERLEALEEDELAAARTGTSSIFDAAADEQRVAARRLGLMYKWFLPIISLVLALLLATNAALMLLWFGRLGLAAAEGGEQFLYTEQIGWAIAVCLGFALISFIFSRFVAGMAKQEAWQNLRGGAGYMVGTTLVLLALGVGLGFRVFENTEVIQWVAYFLPWFMLGAALEIVLNFILALYRPRIAGEMPRAAFDSVVLSYLAAPDRMARSLNEVVNYQFGFDIASSWGYKLLIRSFAWLIAIGVGVFILLNMMVVVEPHQQAVRLQHGRIVGTVQGSGVMWKLPWPIQTAQIEDVNRVRKLGLTARRIGTRDIDLWSDSWTTLGEVTSILVGSTPIHEDVRDVRELQTVFDPDDPMGDDISDHELAPIDDVGELPQDETERAVTRLMSLIDAEITLRYRVREGESPNEGGLMDYLHFAHDEHTGRRDDLTTAERILRAIALREVTQHLSAMTLDEVLSTRRDALGAQLRDRIQETLDSPDIRAGIDVLTVNLLGLRPSGNVAESWEDLNMMKQGRVRLVARATREKLTRMTVLAGRSDRAEAILDKIEQLEDLEADHGRDHPEVMALQSEIENDLRESGGMAGYMIAQAEADRWTELMSTQARASRTRSQSLAYHASPRLYMQRELMRTMIRGSTGTRKYVVGIDPSRLNIDVELKELSPIVDFATAVPDGDQ